MKTLVFTSRHGTPKYFLLTTFGSSVAASVFNEVKNNVVGSVFFVVGINGEKMAFAKVVAGIVVIVGDSVGDDVSALIVISCIVSSVSVISVRL